MAQVRKRLTVDDKINQAILIAQINSDIEELHEIFKQLLSKEFSVPPNVFEVFWHDIQTLVNNISDFDKFPFTILNYKNKDVGKLITDYKLESTSKTIFLEAIDLFGCLAKLRFLLLQFQVGEEPEHFEQIINEVEASYLTIQNAQPFFEAQRRIEKTNKAHKILMRKLVDDFQRKSYRVDDFETLIRTIEKSDLFDKLQKIETLPDIKEINDVIDAHHHDVAKFKEMMQLFVVRLERYKKEVDKILDESIKECRLALDDFSKVETKTDGILKLQKHRLWSVCRTIANLASELMSLNQKITEIEAGWLNLKSYKLSPWKNNWDVATERLVAIKPISLEIAKYTEGYVKHGNRANELNEKIAIPEEPKEKEESKEPKEKSLQEITDELKKQYKTELQSVINTLKQHQNIKAEEGILDFIQHHWWKILLGGVIGGAAGVSGAVVLGAAALTTAAVGGSSTVVGGAGVSAIQLAHDEWERKKAEKKAKEQEALKKMEQPASVLSFSVFKDLFSSLPSTAEERERLKKTM